MKIAFFVSDTTTEKPDYTTTRLAMAAAEAGHDTFYVDLDAISFVSDDSMQVWARDYTEPGGSQGVHRVARWEGRHQAAPIRQG